MLVDRIDQETHEQAERFIRSRTPMLYMANPGCIPLAINPAHAADPALRSAGLGKLRIDTVDEALKVLYTLKPKGGAEDGSLSNLLSSIRCYCGQSLAILSLRDSDCPYEQGLEAFEAYNNQLASLAGWEFNLADPSSPLATAPSLESGDRVYRISRIHMRLIANIHSKDRPELRGVLEVRLVPSSQLRLVVQGTPKSTLSGRVELVGHSGTPIKLYCTEALQIDRKSLPEYKTLEKAFDESLRNVSSAKAILEAAALEIGGVASSPPVKEVIHDLYDELPAADPDAEVVRRLISHSERLYDGPVVASNIRSALDGVLRTPAFAEVRRNFPLAVQADLANLRMPLVKLESADQFIGAFSPFRP